MKKVFLYLYPVQEYNRYFEFSEEYLHEIGRENPYKVLNECIQKRYREKEYEIVYAIYPGKIGGFHFGDCVKKVAEYCYQNGFSTLVDLDLTDLFFSVYYKKDYFKIDEYNPKNYKEFILSNSRFSNMEIAERLFERNYNSPVYGFENDEKKKIKKFN